MPQLNLSVSQALQYGNLYTQSGTSQPLGNGESVFVSSVPQNNRIAIVDISVRSESRELLIEIYSYPGNSALITGAVELTGNSAPVNQNEEFIDNPADFKIFFLSDNVAAQEAVDLSRQTFNQTIYSQNETAELNLNREETRCITIPERSQIVKVTNMTGTNKKYSSVTRWIDLGARKGI